METVMLTAMAPVYGHAMHLGHVDEDVAVKDFGSLLQLS